MTIRSKVLDIVPHSLRRGLREIRRIGLSTLRRLPRNDVIRHRGILVALDPSMGDGPLRALREGQYEGGELAAVERYLEPTDVVLEMGTGIGFITLFCARIVGPQNVHTFEANPALEPLIRRNFELNNMSPNLTIAVLGKQDGQVEIFCEPEYWSSSRLKRSENAKITTVPQIAVSDVFARIKPTMLVIDIEGGEYDLFPLLDLSGVQRVMVEVHAFLTTPEKAPIVEQTLRDAGFVERWACPDRMHLLYERP